MRDRFLFECCEREMFSESSQIGQAVMELHFTKK